MGTVSAILACGEIAAAYVSCAAGGRLVSCVRATLLSGYQQLVIAESVFPYGLSLRRFRNGHHLLPPVTQGVVLVCLLLGSLRGEMLRFLLVLSLRTIIFIA